MDRATRNELLKTISSQKEQIARYEKRLRDVVVAYKGTLKEKEALENTVKAISGHSVSKDLEEKHTSSNDDGLQENTPSSSAGEASGSENEEPASVDEILMLKTQVATLTNSLSTLMSEKTKIESSYQAERKKMREEHEKYVTETKSDVEQYEDTIAQLQQDLEERTSRVRAAQHDREREQDDHALMLRELQKLLAAERGQREGLEQQVDDLTTRLHAADAQVGPVETYKKSVNDLKNELEVVRKRLAASEDAAAQPSPLLLELQDEMAKMKVEHRYQLNQERNKASDTEERLREISAQGEQRVSGLEFRISELSEVVGDYERLRAQDKDAIARMKDRITQLDQENTVLAQGTPKPSADDDAPPVENPQELLEKIRKLHSRLQSTNQKSSKPMDLKVLLWVKEDDNEVNQMHEQCREQLAALREEFERYKLRAQSVLKNKATKETGSKETESLRAQLADAKERLRVQGSEHETELKERARQVESLRESLAGAREATRRELSECEAAFRLKQTELEAEIRKHRDRTIALLVEKDREIELLRARSPETQPRDGRPRTYSVSDAELSASEKDQGDEKEAVVAELVQKSDSGSLLHFAQESARRDVEVQALRRARHTAECALREVQHSSSVKIQKLTDDVDDLREQVRQLERSRSRENANLEYLKNVVYRYMICTEIGGKQNMLRAIATILEFSPREFETVRTLITSGWWGASGAT